MDAAIIVIVCSAKVKSDLLNNCPHSETMTEHFIEAKKAHALLETKSRRDVHSHIRLAAPRSVRGASNGGPNLSVSDIATDADALLHGMHADSHVAGGRGRRCLLGRSSRRRLLGVLRHVFGFVSCCPRRR